MYCMNITNYNKILRRQYWCLDIYTNNYVLNFTNFSCYSFKIYGGHSKVLFLEDQFGPGETTT